MGGGGVDGGLDGFVAVALLGGGEGLAILGDVLRDGEAVDEEKLALADVALFYGAFAVELVVFNALGADVALAVLFGLGEVGQGAGAEGGYVGERCWLLGAGERDAEEECEREG